MSQRGVAISPAAVTARGSLPTITIPSVSVASSFKSQGKAITDDEIYDAETAPISKFSGNDARLEYYPAVQEPQELEYFEFNAATIYDPQNPGRQFDVATDDGFGRTTTDTFKIAYTRWGWNNTGPFVLVNHGVPANQTQWYELVRYLVRAGFRVVVFDMLCMGWSTKPLFLDVEERMEKLRWKYDPYYVEGLVNHVFGETSKFIYLADDWGTGIQNWYAYLFGNKRLIWLGSQDGIEGGSYPVSEIQGFGFATLLEMDEDPDVLSGKKPPKIGSFQFMMMSSGQTMVQILKSMAHEAQWKYDQWSLRRTKRPFYSVDYERNATDPRGRATVLTMPPKFYALKSMVDRSAAALSGPDLLPFHSVKNPDGIKYTTITVPWFFWYGENDKMMSRNNRHRFKYWLPNARVFTALVPRADHFSGFDQPIWVADMIINFHNDNYPPGTPGSLDVPYLGFDGIWKGNEKEEMAGYARLYMS